MSSFYDDLTNYFNRLVDESAKKDQALLNEIKKRSNKGAESKPDPNTNQSGGGTVKTIVIGACGAVLGAYLIKELKLFKLL